MTKEEFGTYTWYDWFMAGYQFKVPIKVPNVKNDEEDDEFFLSMRGHYSRFKGNYPPDIAGWIEDDSEKNYRFQTRMSANYDIIAYKAGTSPEIIDQVIDICNSVPLPR